MKNTKNSNNAQSHQGFSKKPRPEIRDDMDSRKNEEWQVKGDDVTHNKKETKEDKQKKH